MKFYLPPHGQPHFGRRRAVAMLVLGILGLLAPLRAADQATDAKTIDQANFTFQYPANWTVDTKAKDYNPNKTFTLNSPQQSYVQFDIYDKPGDLKGVLASEMVYFDGLAVTTLSKSSIDKWGNYSGMGTHLKGKILDSYPGGIRIFTFNTKEHNVIVVEYYFSSELKDVQSDLDLIESSFKMKN
jgi:hypothetical protein